MSSNILYEKQMIQKFINKVKLEANYSKFLELDFIEKLVDTFKGNYTYQKYPKRIDKCLETVLQFYKEFNHNYYEIIVKGITNKQIIFDNSLKKSYLDINNNIAYIRLYENEGDLFIIVHELAHYIDRNSNPKIIPDDVNFLCEVFSFYIEKKFELWLLEERYDDLISIRKNNRMYIESKMLNAIQYELLYEKLFHKNGKINENEISIEKVRCIMKYDSSNTVNYLLRYPIANILSDYLIDINFDLEKENICQKCLALDLYKVLEKWNNKLLQKNK